MAVLWSTQLLAITLSGFAPFGERTLSELAGEPGAGVLFSAGLVVAAGLFIAFLGHLRRTYPVGAVFSVAMLVGMLGQLVAGIVPLGDGGPGTRIHVTSALILGASIPVLMWRFAADQPAGRWRRRCYQLFWLETAACAVGIVLSQRHVAAVAEVLPAMAFHLWVVVVTLGPATSPAEAAPTAQPSASSRVARMSSP